MSEPFTEFGGARVLITGGLGFIGSNLARRLSDLGARVTVLDSLVPEYGGNLFNLAGYEGRIHINIGDMRDEHGINYLVKDQQFIFNLAGQTSHLDSMQDPFTDLDINCRSQLYLLEACRKHNPQVRIVYTSTRQVYGRPIRLPVDEEHPLSPVDINGVHKLAGCWYNVLYHRNYGLQTTSLRLTNSYGPRMRVRDARQTFVGLWLRQLVEGNEIEVYGDGSQARDLNYVDDVVNALLVAALSPKAEGQIYNLGSLEIISLLDLARLLIELNGDGTFRLVPFPPERKVIDVGDYYADFSRIQRALGWGPTVKLRDGLALTLDYYRKHHQHYW
jgi:UDP-glucose 4-epimerase